jgi:nickel/cobalt transporter (NicO) family protein
MDKATSRSRGSRPGRSLLFDVVADRRWVLGGVVMALVVALFTPLFDASSAAAHPLGNFTVNRYSLLEVDSDELYFLYVLDMAEIPTFQEFDAVDTDADGQVNGTERDAYLAAASQDIESAFNLTIDGAQRDLAFVGGSLTFPAGQAGLQTLRLEAYFRADLAPGEHQIAFVDSNYEGRVGWQEVVVRAADSAEVSDADVPEVDQSERLTRYDESLLSSPLAVRSAMFATRSLATPGETALEAESATVGKQLAASGEDAGRGAGLGRFESLVNEQNLSLGFVALALLIAAGWGAMHAIGPGHGKTVVAAYLVGSRATARHAAFLGLTVTATHTSVVFALGLVTLYLSNYILPEKLFLWLGVASGAMVVALGLGLVGRRLGRFLSSRRNGWNEHGDSAFQHVADVHGHHHDHGHGHSHSHQPPGADNPITWRTLLALGISGGLIPCPSALLVMLAAITLDRVVYGLVLVTAFSVGLAGVLTGVGLLMVYGGATLQRLSLVKRFGGLLATRPWAVQALPVIAPLGVIIAGAIITYDALTRPGLLG